MHNIEVSCTAVPTLKTFLLGYCGFQETWNVNEYRAPTSTSYSSFHLPTDLSCIAAFYLRYLRLVNPENSGADVDAETQAPDQPAGGAGGQHGARFDGA